MKVTLMIDATTDKVKDVHDMVDRVYAAKAKPAAKADKAEAKPAEAAKPAAPTHDRNAVKDALRSLAQLAGKDDAVAILNANGASSISELAEEKFDAVHAAAVKAVAEYVPPTEEVEDDELG